MSARTYDLVLFGATGYTGGLTAEYLARNVPAGTRWALAGHNRSKLETVRRQLCAINLACTGLDLLAADAQDLNSPRKMVDLMWLRYHEQAQKSGARLVHCCGFDSIPSDLGCWFTVEQLPENVPITVEGFVRAYGSFSSGTYHSAINAFAHVREYCRVRKEREPWPVNRRIGSMRGGIRLEKALGTWVVSFPTIDPQVVGRSAAELERYGPDFRYGHYLQVKQLSQVAGLIGGVSAVFLLSQLKPTRQWLLSKKNPGEGPSPEQRTQGWFRVRFISQGGGKRVVTRVTIY